MFDWGREVSFGSNYQRVTLNQGFETSGFNSDKESFVTKVLRLSETTNTVCFDARRVKRAAHNLT